jgi:hypothetical protein
MVGRQKYTGWVEGEVDGGAGMVVTGMAVVVVMGAVVVERRVDVRGQGISRVFCIFSFRLGDWT